MTAAERHYHVRRLSKISRACHYCGRALGRKSATLDHVIPRSRGGTDAAENLVLSCKPCNNAKGSMMPDEFRGGTGRSRSEGEVS